MPSILFHELVGYQFAKKYKKYNTNEFYLGLMAPDAVNAYGFASKEKRWTAHFRNQNLTKWQENIIKFYKENREKFEETYLLGYVIHVLTDIFCDEIYQKKLYPKLIEQGYNYNSAYSYYERGIEKFEDSNINETWWEYAKKAFVKAEKIPINNITEQMLIDWVNYTIDKYTKRKYEKEEFITQNFIDEILQLLFTAKTSKLE